MFGSFIPPSSVGAPHPFQPVSQPPTVQTPPTLSPSISPPNMPSSSEYHLTCLCGAVREPGTLLDCETIPVTAPEICHCNFCRYTTGSLGGSFPKLRGAPSQASLDNCVAYADSPRVSTLHCATCGCGTFIDHKEKGLWFVCSGMIEPSDGSGNQKANDVVRVERHDFLSDTGDGGLVPRIIRLGGEGEEREVVCWDTFPDTKRVSAEEVKEMQRVSIEKGKNKPGKDEKLQVKCRCGGVDLRIRRADYANDSQGVDGKYIPADKEKYIAYLCVCRSCRLQTGVSVQPWAYVPPANITIASSREQIKLEKAAQEPGANERTTLKHFQSSSDVYRSFCGTCGASVFYWADMPGHAVVNVAVGLLRARSGSMAREWLDWTWGRIAHRHEAMDSQLAEAILGEEGKQGIQRSESTIA